LDAERKLLEPKVLIFKDMSRSKPMKKRRQKPIFEPGSGPQGDISLINFKRNQKAANFVHHCFAMRRVLEVFPS
jgi:hypothetical protein